MGGFEPPKELPLYRFSKPAHSTTLPHLRNGYYNLFCRLNKDPRLGGDGCILFDEFFEIFMRSETL